MKFYKVGRTEAILTVLLIFCLPITIQSQRKELREVQLAGIRLGTPFIAYDESGNLKKNCLFAVYGMPDYIIRAFVNIPLVQVQGTTGLGGVSGAPGPYGGQMQGALGMPRTPGGPMMPGGPGFMGAPGMGSSFGGQPTLPSVMAGVSGMAQLAGAPMARPGMPGIPGGPMAPGGFMPEEMGAAGGLPGAGPMMPGREGTGGTAGVTPIFPRPEDISWVIPPFVVPESNEFYFVYRRQGANLSFLMELENNQLTVVAITVAGRRFDGARTAEGNPFKSIKLGDTLERVINRYGRPDEIVFYNPLTLNIISVPSGNMILRYFSDNVEFTILYNRVVRIFIFDHTRVRVLPSPIVSSLTQ